MACNEAQQVAVRFHYQKMAPLGIEDNDYRRVAMALDLQQEDVEKLCEGYAAQNKAAALELTDKLPKIKIPVRICYIGDSLTSERTSHMNIVRAAFASEENVEFLDCAISGWKTSDVIFEFEGKVLDFKPHIIHIMIGTNDARNALPGTDTSTAGLAGYRRNIQQILDYAKQIQARVIVTTIPPTKLSPPLGNGMVPKWETEQFNQILREVCMARGIRLNDMEAFLTDKVDEIIDSFDHVHLNGYGQKLIAKEVLACLLDEIQAMEGVSL